MIATVCSKCADSDPSSVTIVQRSASVFVRRTTDVHHRLDRDRQTGHELLAALRLAVVRHLRLLVELDADAVADEIAHDAESGGLDDGLHRRADVADVIAERRRGNAGVERLRVTSSSRCASALIVPTATVVALSVK